MADNITSSGTFTTSNMKPSPAGTENIDAIWGRNVGDNLGFLRTHPSYFFTKNGTEGSAYVGANVVALSGTLRYNVPFHRWAGHNTIVGTIRGDGTFYSNGNPDCTGTHGVYIYGDLGTYVATTTFATLNIGGNFTVGSTFTFGVDLSSYVSVGSWGTVVPYFSGTSADGNVTSNTNILYTFSTIPQVYTTWV